MQKLLCWFARLLSIAFIAFISMFALDVFSEPKWLIGLLIHLIPTYLLVGITIVAWKNETLGGLLFIIAGVALTIFTRFEGWILAIPCFVIAALYLASQVNFSNIPHIHPNKKG